uniref:Putative secreted peptide n=1 Tax=Anopheles braziliensis TaxID=58242 RepID=A0A2M3ZWQ3_9DIPT
MRKQATSVSMITSMATGSVILAFALPHIFCDSTSAMVASGILEIPMADPEHWTLRHTQSWSPKGQQFEQF